ncbi:7TM diverse intracellular signaling domain-containing protein [Aquimarina sp. 2201CG5-10]|uniref:7TM diverse intracellular signaling domain-containing protein n=1 Tax=Aquimarina callyspongiae TaxID=3098150 RepID=UPI002AB526D4|nr:7TM diverse intracellular signaling domain-containing protein [Aquimarina sp. 2201CG5-10]MDY8137941.1 7TM diverse intracellular signaling domain-containing protein [Aquimarina sp. 2201CG5-10]
MSTPRKQYSFVVFLLLILCLSSCISKTPEFSIENGEMDLSNIDFNTTKKVNLNGDWQFYWKQFPFEKRVFSTAVLHDPSVTQLPGGWIGDYFTGNKHPAKGYATYRLKINLRDPLVPLSLKIPRSHTSLQVWVNGQKIEESGVFGVQSETATPKLAPLLIDIPKDSEIDLLIPISNYEYRVGGGFIQGITLGNRKFLRTEREQQLLIESLSAAAVLVVAIFSILFYYVESRQKIFLYFGAFSVFGVLRFISVGESTFISLIPDAPFWLVHRLRFIPFYLGMGIGGLYFYKLFPKELSKKVVQAYFWISVIFAGYLLVMPTYLSSYAFIPYQFIALFGILYVVFAVIKAVFNRRPEAKLVITAYTVVAMVVIHDLLVVQQLIDSIFLANYAFVAFIVMQVIVLFRTYKSYTEQIDQLSDDLSTAGKQLQYKEEDITTLATDNAMRLQYKKQVLEQLREIQKQNTDAIGNAVKKLSHEIRAQIKVEEKLSFQQEHIDLLNTEFNKRLLEKYPSLSKTEQEICGLMRLKMSTKEIATYRNTSDGAIRVAKNRIRKKIQLTSQEDLQTLMASF